MNSFRYANLPIEVCERAESYGESKNEHGISMSRE